jgi:hypothetical protein
MSDGARIAGSVRELNRHYGVVLCGFRSPVLSVPFETASPVYVIVQWTALRQLALPCTTPRADARLPGTPTHPPV